MKIQRKSSSESTLLFLLYDLTAQQLQS